ncbi:M14 family metallopeptidase [Parapedobacter koreensis]|uniref:Zinc carboxypeptidase n=1 Tax=Parapedobacter koreensis TaxID=332977 RepID=A0A1H7LGU9_9SPHI|nr:M14 metallopeptidase family protein [Parapedobacter koreensis]SEK98049.1 Zinc carboxypeptidase [Parapedobacter koreensis]
MKRIKNYTFLWLLCLWQAVTFAQSVPTPQSHFGFSIGDDYRLANYSQTEAYFKKLAESDRVKLVDIGKTEEGRTQYMLIITSPENIKKLDEYKSISTKLAYAEGLTDEDAKRLASTGKAVVWIDGGLHSTEMVGTHQLIEMAYQLTSKTDEETLRILDDVIVLLTHANPDGQELVSNWYMRNSDETKRAMNTPVLYHKYIGHDNNRDFYMVNMKESENMNRQLFLEWMPQVMYNHHQSAPAGAVVAGPPYTDPFNYNIDPLLMTGIDAVGASMINRLNVEDKPGFTRMKGSPFSTWYNGGLRTTTYFHNVIGLLTEIIGNPTPMEVPLVPERLVPNNNTPNPVTPQKWHFKQSIDYSISLNYAILDYAARHREQVLYNIYKMGKNSIAKGSKDYWQLTPRNIDQIQANYEADMASGKAAESAESLGGRMPSSRLPDSYYESVFANPEKRDARAYILSADQADFPTAVKFINTLVKNGIFIDKATADFTVNGKQYPKGSYIVKTDQAFRPHIIDMFEPQDYPNDFAYPGGPPTRPYDVAGWTLAYQMGIDFDRILDGIDGPFERLPHGVLEVPPAQSVSTSSKGFLISSNVNNAFIVVNDLLKANVEVHRVQQATDGLPAGSFYVPAKGLDLLKQAAAELGVQAILASRVPANMVKIAPARIALFDNYGGSMPSGWVRWMLEQYHFGFNLIFPQEIDGGNLKEKYDIILFIESGIPPFGRGGMAGRGGFGGRGPDPADLPEEYRHMVGSLTAEKSIPQLKAFLDAGGDILTTGSSTALAYHLGLPVKNALVETIDGVEQPIPGERFYIPGSVMRVKVNPAIDAAWGMSEDADVIFNSSPVFDLKPEASLQGIEALAWFATDKPLRSGWAWGQNYLEDGVAAFKAPVGKGNFYAYGPQITYRAQPHGTFKFLFNTLYQ